MNKMQTELLEFVKKQHGDQKRKYTGEPYWTHVVEVAEIVEQYEPLGYEAALCHDLFEDTHCTFKRLNGELIKIGYATKDAHRICTIVNELTNVFNHKDYPHYNREKRKNIEAERLGKISYIAQSIKYSDIIHNIESIVDNDAAFAIKYLKEKETILFNMTDGNPDLFHKCLVLLEKSKLKLKNNV